MRVPFLFRLLCLLLLPLAGCGDLPWPFMGNPGATARRLAVPVTPLLAVPLPDSALLPLEARRDLAHRLATDLQREEIPALAREPHRTDWRLRITASERDGQVTPRYAVVDPANKEQGNIDGAQVPLTDWRAGTPAMLERVTRDGVPRILALMTSIRATRDRADPNSLLNRVAKLYVPEVKGAPGDGNASLTRLIRSELKQFGPLVQVTPENTDFTVRGDVSTAPMPNGQQRIEIIWTVTRPSGVVSGKVSQLNAIPRGSLNGNWGEVAEVVTREAANGIFRVVERFIGRDPDAPAAKPGTQGSGASTSGTPATGSPANRATPASTSPANPSAPKPGASARRADPALSPAAPPSKKPVPKPGRPKPKPAAKPAAAEPG